MNFTGGASSTDSWQRIATRRKWKWGRCKVHAISEASPRMWPRSTSLICAESFVVKRFDGPLGRLAADGQISESGAKNDGKYSPGCYRRRRFRRVGRS